MRVNFNSYLLKDKLLKDGVLLMVAALVSHISNILFQMFMGRTLPGDEYALLCTLLGFTSLISLPLSAMNTAVNHSVSLMVSHNREGDVSRLLRKWFIRVAGIGGILFLLSLLFTENIAVFLHLDRAAPVVILALVAALVISSSVAGGAINGLQMFGVATVGLQVSAILRLLAGVGFVFWFAKAAGWGLLGHALGLATNLFIISIFLWKRLHGQPASKLPIPSIGSYTVLSFIVLMAFAVLLRADMILVKHFFLPEEAIQFAYATTIGHIVIFLPMPLARAMFPKVVTDGSTTKEHQRILLKSIFYTVIFTLPAALGCSLFGWIPLRIIYGIKVPSTELLHLVSAMGWVMFPLAVVNIMVLYNLAQRRFMGLIPVFFIAVGYVVGAILFHDTVWHIVAVGAVVSWGSLMALLLGLFKIGKENVGIGDES